MKRSGIRSARHRAIEAALLIAIVTSLLLPGSPSTAFGGPGRGPTTNHRSSGPAVDRLGQAVLEGVPASPPAVTWVNLSVTAGTSAPPGGPGANLVYDPIDQEFVYFGGCLSGCPGGSGTPCASYCPANETWVLKGGHWFNVTDPKDSPPARVSASMDFDAHAGGVLLFGGWDGIGLVFNDTWLFRGGYWTNVSYLSAAPPARLGAALAFDPDADENASILTGGCNRNYIGACTSDTFAWRPGAGWSPFNTSTPPSPRDYASMAYSPIDHALVYFGGRAGCIVNCPLNDTWELYAGTWWAIHSTSSAPTGRFGATLTYDAALGGLVLYSGQSTDSGCCLADAYLFSRGTWAPLTLPATLDGRWNAAADPDGAYPTPVVMGGIGPSGPRSDLWALEPTLGVTLTVPSSTVRVNQPAVTTTSIVGGTAPLAVRTDFGDSTAATASSAGAPVSLSHAYFAPGTYTVSTTVVDDLGVSGSSTGTVTVRPGPVVVASAAPAAGDVGQPIQFSASLVNETASSSGFAWTFGDGANGTGSASSHTYLLAGSYDATVAYTDPNGSVARAAVAVSIAIRPGVTLTVPVQVTTGEPVGLSVNVTGGSAPFRYAWKFGDGSSGMAPAPVHVYATPGTYTVDVWVNDSAGVSSHESSQVSVVAGSGPPAPSAGSSGPPSWFWPGVGIILVAAGAAGLLLWRARRRPT